MKKPEWMTEAGLETLKAGYLLEGEDPQAMYGRIARAAAERIGIPGIEQRFLDAFNEGFLCLASPILANMGTDRGLPISCFGTTVPDSIDGIYRSLHEFAMLSKHGGGVSQYFGEVRASGEPIKNGRNGASNGTIPFAKVFDSTVVAVSQGTTRRGANAFYWDVSHGDVEQALRIRRPLGSEDRQCLSSNHGVVVDRDFMRRVVEGSCKKSRKLWSDIIRTRIETGEPYLMFKDNANTLTPRQRVQYRNFGLENRYSNICTEIILPADSEHTFVCCISSLPIHRFRQWEKKGVVRLMVFLLDAVLDEFIEKAERIPGYERAVRFAKKSRAIGVGALGYHTFLQQEGIAIGSLQEKMWNRKIFRHIRDEAEAASRELAKLRGEPVWCAGTGYRNSHLMAIAPTATNSIISGHVSAGIEPWGANIFAHKTAKGTFVLKNRELERELEAIGKNTEQVWTSINAQNGSVAHLDFLDPELKKVFLTAYELDMIDLINSAADRQEFIDQGQSLNFFFETPAQGPRESDSDFADRLKRWRRHVNLCHLHAYKRGLKTLYYCRNKAITKADLASRQHEKKRYAETLDELEDCKNCEG